MKLQLVSWHFSCSYWWQGNYYCLICLDLWLAISFLASGSVWLLLGFQYNGSSWRAALQKNWQTCFAEWTEPGGLLSPWRESRLQWWSHGPGFPVCAGQWRNWFGGILPVHCKGECSSWTCIAGVRSSVWTNCMLGNWYLERKCLCSNWYICFSCCIFAKKTRVTASPSRSWILHWSLRSMSRPVGKTRANVFIPPPHCCLPVRRHALSWLTHETRTQPLSTVLLSQQCYWVVGVQFSFP